MNADFDYHHHSPDLDAEDTSKASSDPSSAASPALAKLGSDRFELLSAYLDGETSPEQRKQVEQWIDTDPSVQRLYTQLLRMREAMKAIPVPEFAVSDPDELVNQVFAKVDRQPRVLVLWAGAGAAIAATCVAAVSGLILGGNRPFFPQTASSPDSPAQSVAYSPTPELAASTGTDSLMIGLDRPVVDIPHGTLVQWNESSSN